MPGFDRSGPMGAGSMTGGRRGICGRPANTAGMPGYGYGRGMGFGRRYGRGRGADPAFGRYPYPPEIGSGYPVSKTDELEMLRSNADAMRNSLDTIRQRIDELEKE